MRLLYLKRKFCDSDDYAETKEPKEVLAASSDS